MKKFYCILIAAMVISLGLAEQSTAATCPDVAGTYEVTYKRAFKIKGLGTEKWKGLELLILEEDGTFIFGDATGTYSCDEKGKKILLELDDTGLDEMEDHFIEIIQDLASDKGVILQQSDITCIINTVKISKLKIHKKTAEPKGKSKITIKGIASAEMDGKQEQGKFSYKSKAAIGPNTINQGTIDPFPDDVETIDSYPEGLTFDSQNNLYISTVSGKIVKLDGSSLSTFIAEGVGGLDFNEHIRFSQANFYIQNIRNLGTGQDLIDEVLLFDGTGAFINRILDENDIDALLFDAIAVNSKGQLYIALTTLSDNVVIRVDPDGKNLTNVIQSGDGGVYVPVSLAIDSKDNLYVGTPSVVSKFDHKGNFKKKIVEENTHGFEFASHLALDRNDNLYIGNYMFTEPSTLNVLRFDKNANFQAEFIPPGAGGLSALPEDMGFDAQRRLYFADIYGDDCGILRFDASGKFDRTGVVCFSSDLEYQAVSAELFSKRLERERHYRELEIKDKTLAAKHRN